MQNPIAVRFLTSPVRLATVCVSITTARVEKALRKQASATREPALAKLLRPHLKNKRAGA
jgi:hypothetical protein